MFIDQKELSKRWNVSPRTLERWRWMKEGPNYVKIVGRILYDLEHIKQYEKENTKIHD